MAGGFTFAILGGVFARVKVPVVGDKWGYPLSDSVWPFVSAGGALFVTAVLIKYLTTRRDRQTLPIRSDRLAVLLSFLVLAGGAALMADYQTLRSSDCRQYDGLEAACQNNSTAGCVWNPLQTGTHAARSAGAAIS